MPRSDPSESPIQAVADVTGGDVTAAFELLGDETRLAILLALWEAKSPLLPITEEPSWSLSFTELRTRLGLPHGSQFNYHLGKLTGQFVRRTDDGYWLTESAEQLLHAVFAGTFRDDVAMESQPVDGSCDRCGDQLFVTYEDGVRYDHCRSCEGFFPGRDNPPGTISILSCPPAGLVDRSPRAFYRASHVWTRHNVYSTFEGVCPDCSGAIRTSFHACETHDAEDGTTCEHCGSGFEALWLFVCDVCKYHLRAPVFGPIAADMGVRTFCYQRGLDLEASMDDGNRKPFLDAIVGFDVIDDDPLRVAVRVDLDGDRLEATLDEDASVIDVTERSQEPA